MKFSIITIVLNKADTVLDAMRSVVNQRLMNFEIEYIVVDGASADGTVALIQDEENEVKRAGKEGFTFKWISEPDRGLYDGINKGIKMATGDVVGILNADDMFDGDDVLLRVAHAFERKNHLDCLFGNIRFVNGKDQTMRVCFARFWKPWMFQWGYMPPHPGVFIRRGCFEKWGLYVPQRSEYCIAADCELLIRFFRVNRMRARYMPICITKMRLGGLSTKDAKARKKLNQEIIKANRANGYFCIWPMLLPKYAIKMWEVILPRLGLIKV